MSNSITPKKGLAKPTPDVRLVMRPPHGLHMGLSNHSKSELIVPIERGLAILNAFDADNSWLGNQEIADHTAIPRSTVTRLTQTLAGAGCLRHSPSLRKYRLAPAVLAMGYAAIANSDVVTIAKPMMQQLADENGVFVALASRDGPNMEMLETCHSASSLLTLGLRAGVHLPITATSVGLALLAALPKTERDYLLDQVLRHHDKNHRVLLRERVDDAVQQVASRGFFVSIGIWSPDVAVVAAPLFIPNKPPMAIACAGPKKQVTKAQLQNQVGPKLMKLVSMLQSESWHYHD